MDREEIVDNEGIYWIESGIIRKRGGIMDGGKKSLTARRNTGQRGEILDSEGKYRTEREYIVQGGEVVDREGG